MVGTGQEGTGWHEQERAGHRAGQGRTEAGRRGGVDGAGQHGQCYTAQGWAKQGFMCASVCVCV